MEVVDVAIVGAGPAGLSCAHRLAMLGNDVTVFEARPKSGGLNEYGLAAHTQMSRTLFHYLGDPRWHKRRMADALEW